MSNETIPLNREMKLLFIRALQSGEMSLYDIAAFEKYFRGIIINFDTPSKVKFLTDEQLEELLNEL